MIFIAGLLSCGAQFKLPVTWEKDFNISAGYGGSMDGSFMNLTISYDSCNYRYASPFEKIEVKNAFRMTAEHRNLVLKKMRDLTVNTIRTKQRKSPVHDAPSRRLCFGANCIAGGASIEMSEKDGRIYDAAYAFLETFAKSSQ
jgi:hypothetical protein